MTSENDDLIDRKKIDGTTAVDNEGITQDGFGDPSGAYPDPGYYFQSSISKSVVGSEINNLRVNAGIPGINVASQQKVSSQYPLNTMLKTPRGHVFELNDTPAGERILLLHKDGAGIDIRPDGSVIINSRGNRVDVSNGDHRLVVEGNGNVSYFGNLNLNVSGDYNVTVGGNYTLKVSGNYVQNIVGSLFTTVNGILKEVVSKSKSVITLGGSTLFSNGNVSNYVKGLYTSVVKGTASYSHGGTVSMTAETEFDIASNNINVVGNDVTFAGHTGTIGGENVIAYAKNAYIGKTVHSETVQTTVARATTFHGDLVGDVNGVAKGALTANSAPRKGGGGQSQSVTVNNTKADTTATAKPTVALMDDILKNSELGVKLVKIDEDGGIFNQYNRGEASGGLTERKLSAVGECRSILKDEANLQNSNFIATSISEGILSPNFANQSPPNIGRLRNSSTTARIGREIIGPKSQTRNNDKYKPADVSSRSTQFTTPLDAKFNPNNRQSITLKTLLDKNIPLSRFTGATGDKVTLNHIRTEAEKFQIARNFYVHAQVISMFRNLDQFKNFSIMVAEGLYVKGPNETPTKDSFNDLATTGRAVAYEIYNSSGTLSPTAMFDYAEFLKDNFHYDKLELSYDQFHPNQSLHCQIIVEIPAIPESFSANFKMQLSTKFNGRSQSESDLIEITLPVTGPQ